MLQHNRSNPHLPFSLPFLPSDPSSNLHGSQEMAEAREHLIDTSDKLRLAFSDIIAIDGDVAALTTGVGRLPLSEAAARVAQGARTAAAVASKLLGAAEAAEAAASEAEAAVTALSLIHIPSPRDLSTSRMPSSA